MRDVRTAPRVGRARYRRGGWFVHAPHRQADRAVTPAAIATRDLRRRRDAETDHPAMPICGSLARMVEGERAGAGTGAVAIMTVPATRQQLVLEAPRLGADVDADEPCAPAAALGLGAMAARAGRVRGVFHDRRRDTDVRAVRGAGSIGRPVQIHSRPSASAPHHRVRRETVLPGSQGSFVASSARPQRTPPAGAAEASAVLGALDAARSSAFTGEVVHPVTSHMS